jgi:hypothetical protein
MGHVASWVLLTTLLGAQDIQGSRPPAPASVSADTVAAPAEIMAAPAAEVRASPVFASARAAFAPPQARPAPCDGCPPRRLGHALLQTVYINALYEAANLIRGQVTAHITPSTWWTNMKRGWEWDLDDFVVNQIGHPYQGNNYFTAGRANGLNFWESAGLTAFGSGTWEYFGETNQASLNDFINTTLGGIALGEMFHRTAWLIRDTRATGRGRMWKEIGAMAIDPMTGVNRFISGDAEKVSEKPAEFVPTRLDAFTAAGAVWIGSDTKAVDAQGTPFIETELLYGNLEKGESRIPYDAFGVRLEFGGGSPISEALVRGRLLGQPLKSGALQFSLLQDYQFTANDAYQFGAQAFEANLGHLRQLSTRNSMWMSGWGGVTILGAVDSQPLPTPIGQPAPEPEEEEDAGQGVSTGPRGYDYGPGTNAGGFFRLLRDGRPLFAASYEVHHIRVLDGVRANHVLQRTRITLALPIRGPLGFGVAGEYFDRRTLYKDPLVTDKHFHYPQIRAFFTWSTK